MCNSHCNPVLEHLCDPNKIAHPQTSTNLFSLSIDLPFLDISCKWIDHSFLKFSQKLLKVSLDEKDYINFSLFKIKSIIGNIIFFFAVHDPTILATTFGGIILRFGLIVSGTGGAASSKT